jgi:hypothetical protein
MKSLFTLRRALALLAVGGAFGAGWVFALQVGCKGG